MRLRAVPVLWAGLAIVVGLVAGAAAVAYALDRSDGSPEPGEASPFAGETIHYSARETSFSAGSLEPFQGEPLRADVWVQVDDRGEPDLVVARYYTPDGTSARFVRLAGDSAAVYWAHPPGGDPDQCVQGRYEPFLRSPLVELLPAVQLPRRLEVQGYLRSATEPDPPEVTPVAGGAGQVSATPERLAPRDLQEWQLHEEAGGFFTDHVVIIEGDTGRVVAYYVTVRNERFEIIREFERVRGPIERYASGEVDASSFDLADDEIAALRAACEGS